MTAARRPARRLLAVAALAALAGSEASARELWRSGDAAVALSGSARELAIGTGGTDADDFAASFAANACFLAQNLPECPAFDRVNERAVATSLTRLRTRLDLRATAQWSAVVVYDHEVRAGTLDTLEATLGEGLGGDSFLRAEDDIVDGDRVQWRHLLYRGYVQLETEHWEAAVGRQRVPWGVGRLWNPIDRFNAIGPLALEADQSAGVDAVVVRWLPSGFTFVEGVFAPLRDLEDGSYALRLHGVLRDVDYSLVAGLFEETPTGGFDLAGNVGDAAARLEFVFADPHRKVRPVGADRARAPEPFAQVVASIDYLFDVGDGLYVLLEHFYNGGALGFGGGRAGPLLELFEETDVPPAPELAALPGPFVRPTTRDRFAGSRVVTFAEHQTGLLLGYDLTPELHGDLLAIWDWNGASVAVFPTLRYSPTGWLDMTLGVQLFAGPRRSQFGDVDPVGYAILEAFF